MPITIVKQQGLKPYPKNTVKNKFHGGWPWNEVPTAQPLKQTTFAF